MAQMTALRRRMIDDMTVRNLSPATQQSYVYAVAKFSRFFSCRVGTVGDNAEVAHPVAVAQQLALARADADGEIGGAARPRPFSRCRRWASN